MHKVSPLSVAVLCLTLCCACARSTTDNEPYPLSGTRWQGSNVLEEMADGIVYRDSTTFLMVIGAAKGNLHSEDYLYEDGALVYTLDGNTPFSYRFSGTAGEMTFRYLNGDSLRSPFSVQGNLLILPSDTLHKVQ